ncbi:hypothetical protein BDQ17DRAFT_1355842 [Cyathus striatus]|nr:hypothetical protein BDQ17DRAFT_1355842 [Cyathus striatus]
MQLSSWRSFYKLALHFIILRRVLANLPPYDNFSMIVFDLEEKWRCEEFQFYGRQGIWVVAIEHEVRPFRHSKDFFKSRFTDCLHQKI